MLGRAVEFEAVTYGSDMRIFNLYGKIPTVLYGPGDVSLAHTVNEHIEIDLVLEAVCSITLMLINWCGGAYISE
jgi:acetylornithine deacetylase